MIADWIQKFIAENTMDGYMGEPAVGVGKVLELVAKVEAEAIERCAKMCEDAQDPPNMIVGQFGCAMRIRALLPKRATGGQENP